jgi:hypothetical protein
MNDLKAYLAKPRAIARIVGLSGLGKTRVALETFRPPKTQDATGTAETASVIYTNADDPGSLVNLLHELRADKSDGILIVDDCEIGLHRRLAQIVQHPDANLSLVTLDYDPATVDGEMHYVELTRLGDQSIKGILKQAYPGLSDAEVGRACAFAQGFPRMAVMLGDAALTEEGRVVALHDDVVLKRLVWGREAPSQVGQSVLAACSMFDTLGVDGASRVELEFVAQALCDIPWEQCFQWIQRFQRRQLIQRRGDFIQVLPKPLALRLAGERWAEVHPESAKRWFTSEMPERLRTALCDQLALLDFHPQAQTLVESLCGPRGPFRDPEVLNTETGSRCFRSLVETNPEATLEALEFAFGSSPKERIHNISSGRRNLIWAIEKLCFRRETFVRAARLLLKFAAAENESWSNNATSQFEHLFQLYLSGTEASGDVKLHILDEALSSQDSATVEIAINALEQGLTTLHFTRIGGPERQGTGKPLEDWRPTNLEARKYLVEVLSRLSAIASTDLSHAGSARAKLPHKIRGLIGSGLIDEVRAAIDKVCQVHGSYWPEALGAVADTLHFDSDGFPLEVKQKLNELYDELVPRSLEDRLRFFVTETPWGFLRRGAAEGDEEAPIRELADECSKAPGFVIGQLPTLLVGTQRNYYPFGNQLGRVFPEPERFVTTALLFLASTSSSQANSALLGAFLSGLEGREPGLVQKTLDTAASDNALCKYLVDLTIFVTIAPRDITRVISALDARRIPPTAARPLAYGSVLRSVSVDSVAALLDALLARGNEGVETALDIGFFYLHNNEQYFDNLRSRIKQILLTPGLLMLGGRRDGYHFEQLTKRILKSDNVSDVAEHVAREIVAVCRERRFPYELDHLINSLLAALLEHQRYAVWPIFETAINTANSHESFYLEHVLGRGIAQFENHTGPIFKLGDKFILEWCTRSPEKAPVFVGKIAPLLSSEHEGKSWTTIVQTLFDEFGDREEVLGAISANMGTFGWTGSMVPYYEQFLSPLMSLTSHPRAQVRAFANQELQYFREAIRREAKREEERDLGIF